MVDGMSLGGHSLVIVLGRDACLERRGLFLAPSVASSWQGWKKNVLLCLLARLSCLRCPSATSWMVPCTVCTIVNTVAVLSYVCNYVY